MAYAGIACLRSRASPLVDPNYAGYRWEYRGRKYLWWHWSCSHCLLVRPIWPRNACYRLRPASPGYHADTNENQETPDKSTLRCRLGRFLIVKGGFAVGEPGPRWSGNTLSRVVRTKVYVV